MQSHYKTGDKQRNRIYASGGAYDLEWRGIQCANGGDESKQNTETSRATQVRIGSRARYSRRSEDKQKPLRRPKGLTLHRLPDRVLAATINARRETRARILLRATVVAIVGRADAVALVAYFSRTTASNRASATTSTTQRRPNVPVVAMTTIVVVVLKVIALAVHAGLVRLASFAAGTAYEHER